MFSARFRRLGPKRWICHDWSMSVEDLEAIIARARTITMTSSDVEAQRESFAYGNVALEDSSVTHETVRYAVRTIQLRGNRE